MCLFIHISSQDEKRDPFLIHLDHIRTWMYGQVRALSRAKKADFRSGDKEVYNTAKARLKAGIK